MSNQAIIASLTDSEFESLCQQLSDAASHCDSTDDWPTEALSACAKAGVYRWFLPVEAGGLGWSEQDQTRAYLRLSQANLTATFIITQLMGAVRRIAGSENDSVRDEWLQKLLSGDAFGTVGISHLSTSRQHVSQPVLMATDHGDHFVLDGMAPWVTGVPHADVYVIGAAMQDGRELLAAVPRCCEGLTPFPGNDLIALSASCTDRLELKQVTIASDSLIAGPVEQVMRTGTGGGTGGLQTSTLAIGLSSAAVGYLVVEAEKRSDLRAAADELRRETAMLRTDLLRAAAGDTQCDVAGIRGRANRLVLRATQAALTAAKGAGFVQGHPVGRWCREALFFLVWSCPQPVAQAHLCELAGIQGPN